MWSLSRCVQRVVSRFRRVKAAQPPPPENDGPGTVHKELKRLVATVKNKHQRKDFEQQMDAFFLLYTRHLSTKYVTEKTQYSIDCNDLHPPSATQVTQYPDLTTDFGAKRLQKLAVIKICTAESGIPTDVDIRDGMNAIELTLAHLSHLNATYGVSIPLVLIEPFGAGALPVAPDCQPRNVPFTRLQGSRHPLLHADTLLPVPTATRDPEACWGAPGSGDVYDVLWRTGTLHALREDGKEHAFVSNVDDVGAMVDETIFAHICMSKLDFLLEVCDRHHDPSSDVLVDCAGQLRLVGASAISHHHSKTGKRNHQPTGSFWVRLNALENLLDEGPLEVDVLPVEFNADTIGVRALRLETSAVSAIKYFSHSEALVVPRSRHMPVHTLAQVLMLRSDLYSLRHGVFVPFEADTIPPTIKLSHECTTVADLHRQFAQAPHMHNLEHLSVVGDVRFGRDVTLRGTVIIHARAGEKIEVPQGSVLEDKLVVGNMRISSL